MAITADVFRNICSPSSSELSFQARTNEKQRAYTPALARY